MEIPSAVSMQNGSTKLKQFEQEIIMKVNDISMDQIREQNNFTIDDELNTPDNNTKNLPKYHIMDLFWIINPKYQKIEKEPDEVDMATLSYNMDFGNLRIAFYNIPKDAFYNATLFHQKLERITNASIYPGACFRISNDINKNENFTCLEQLITYTGENWQRERPVVSINKLENKIRVNIYDVVNKKNNFFDFENEQCMMLEHACKFVVTSGFSLVGNNIIKR